MKRIVLLFAIGLCMALPAVAQVKIGLERVLLKRLDAYRQVEPSSLMVKEVKQSGDDPTIHYFYMADDESRGLDNFYDNGKLLHIYDEFGRDLTGRCQVRPFVTSVDWRKSIFVVKYSDPSSSEMAYGREWVVANASRQKSCDSIVSMSDDGFIFRSGNKYYRQYYKNGTTETQTKQVVWPERRVFHLYDSVYFSSKQEWELLSDGDTYYRSAELTAKVKPHYYYLYRDDYMPYTVLVIDGKEVELQGVYDYDSFRLKYSYNGYHWMAVGGDRFWVDGVAKSAKGYEITDFLVNDGGEYMYKASKTEKNDVIEVVVINGEIKQNDARVGYFHLNANQKLKYHFFTGGRCFVYDDGDIDEKTDEFRSLSYCDDMIVGRTVKLDSGNGFQLTYVTGQEGVWVNNIRQCESVPFHVEYDLGDHLFRWTAVEVMNDGTKELVMYKYHCRN